MISSHHCNGFSFSPAGPIYRFLTRRLLGAQLAEALEPAKFRELGAVA